MRKTRLLSVLLSVVLVLGCVPMLAVSADELDGLDVSTPLVVDTPYTGNIDETDPYVDTHYWSGYAKGFTVELEPGVIYTIKAHVECDTASYVDRAIAVVPDGAPSVSGYYIARADAYEYYTNITTTLKFSVTEAGKYNVIVWGYCDDENENSIFGETTLIDILMTESPAIKFDKKLTVGKAYTGTVNETDPYIETIDWSGYVQGFYADLMPGTYKITATVSGEGATYADRAIAVHPDGIVLDAYENAIAYNCIWADADTATVSVVFEVGTAGIYKIPVWGYLDDENDNGMFGEDTSLTVLIEDKVTQEDYLGMPVTATLTVGTPYEGTLGETDQYISTYDWSGYAKAFAVELEAGKMYSAYAYAECADKDYIDRAITIVPEKFIGDYSLDSIAYARDEVEEGKAVIDFFTVEEDGTYYVIEWGYCQDVNGNDLTGDSACLEVCVDYAETSVVDIYTSDDLLQFNADMHDGKYEGALEIVFHNDIDMTDIAWDKSFDSSGVYFNVNGNGYTITNLSAPLLGDAYEAYISDLDMSVDLEFVADEHEIGGEMYNFGLYAGYVENRIVMDNCHVTGDILFDGYVNYGLGALVGEVYGYDYNSKFVNCSFEGSITASDGYYIGGLVGDAEYNVSFEDCYADVTIDVSGGAIGGIAGYVEDYNSFDRCYAFVDINGGAGSYNIGGLAGIIDEDNLFTDCYAEGAVQGRDDIGGLVGDSSCCGYNNFINCYTTVDVTGAYYVGGFIGEAYDSDNFENCYAAGSVTCTDPYYIDGAGVGMFFGYSSYHSMTFTNCFAAYSEDYDAYGDADNFEINGIIYSVNFDDEESVSNMEDTLNEYVEENSGLYYWAGRNDANGPEFSETPPFLKGDVNGDGKVNLFDYVALKSHVLGKSPLGEDKLVRADVNGDGKINMFDYVALKTLVVKG